MNFSVALPAIPILAKGAAQTVKTSQKVSVDLFQYDFVGLASKLAIVYGIAWTLGQLVAIVNGTEVFFSGILRFFGFNVPTLPKWFIDFYNTGFNGIQYWDVIKTLLVVIVFAEFLRYQKACRQLGQSLNPATVATFLLIGSTLGALTFPAIISRLTFQSQVSQ